MSPEIVLSEAARGRDELPEGVRVRIAIDLLAELDADAALTPRGSASRCRWDRVRIDAEGRAHLAGDGDTSGAAWLLWEVLAGRATSDEGTLPRVHDVVDQIHPDLDDVTARALEGDPETIGELHEALARAGDGLTGEGIDVLRALGLAVPAAAPVAVPKPAPTPEVVSRVARTPTPAPPPIPEEPRAEEPRAEERPPVELAPALAPSLPAPHSPEPIATPEPVATETSAAQPAAPEPPPAPTLEEALEPALIAALLENPPAYVASPSTRPRTITIEPPPDSLSAWGFTPEPMPAAPKAPTNLEPPDQPAPLPEPLVRATPPSASQVPPPDDAWGPPSSSSRGADDLEVVPLAETHPPLSLPPFVLLVKGDETDDSALATMIRSAGYGLLVRHDATSGFLAARQVLPDVIVVDAELAEGPGEVLVRRIRSDPSRLAATPIVLLAPAEATAIVDRAAGADAILAKPYRFGDVVAEVAALVKMSAELRATREALPLANSSADKVLQLDLGEISLAVMLTIFEMERRSGVFDIRSEGRRAHLEIVGGHLTVGAALGRQLGPLGTLRTVLRWRTGRVSFRAIADRSPPDGAPSISEILTEATRMMDEEDHDVAPKA